MRIKLKPFGLTALFLVGVFFLYLGFSGMTKLNSEQEQVRPNQNSGVIQVAREEVTSSFFVSYRQDREVKRQQQRDLLNELINNSNVAADTRKAAQNQILELTQIISKESEIENQVLAKGFRDVVASVSPGGVNLTVYGERFAPGELTKLQEIAVRATGVRLENVVVVPRR